MDPLLAPATFGGKSGVEAGVKQSSSESWNGREVYIEIVPDASKKPLRAVIRSR